MFSTALPAIAAMTRPAKARLMPSWSTVGASAVTNQSDTNAAPTPPSASSTMPTRSGRWWAPSSSGSGSAARAATAGGASATATPPRSAGSARAMRASPLGASGAAGEPSAPGAPLERMYGTTQEM